MSKAYSTYHPPGGYTLRGLGGGSEDTLVEKTNEIIQRTLIYFKEDPTSSDLSFIGQHILAAHGTRLWNFHPVRHYFLRPGLLQFLEQGTNMVKTSALDLLPDIPGVKGRLYEPAHALRRLTEQDIDGVKDSARAGFPLVEYFKSEFLPSAFFLHFPRCERDRSIMVIPRAAVWGGKRTREGDDIIHTMAMHVQNPDEYFYAAAHNSGDELISCELGRIVAGFALYMDAFPETVRDMQTPREVGASPKVHRGACKYVGMSEVIKRELRNSTSPHWRNGHLRNLRSERFTKKRGQSVWVSGSFVKGKAKEVLSPDEC